MKYAPIVLVCLAFACATPPPAKKSATGIESAVDSIAKRAVDSLMIAGMNVAVVKGSDTLLMKSYGYADLNFKTPMPMDASFEIGSVTKQFTGAAILQLAEAGKLSLDDNITKYITFDTHGKTVTIRQLLSHTSGIKGYTERPWFDKLSTEAHPRDTLLRIIEKESYDFEPGDALIYNNTGFFMLGLIIEKVSGMTYAEYVQRNLFEPAGMTHSYYCSETKIVNRKAHGYDTRKEGLGQAGFLDHTWPYAAGSLCSTAGDLIKWNRALHGGKILKDAAYQEMLTPVKLNDGTLTHYAKGLVVSDFNGRKLIRHGGGIQGFLTENSYYPEDDLSIIVLINSTGPVAPSAVAEHIAGILYPNKQLNDVAFTGDSNSLIGDYLGTGRGDQIKITIAKDGDNLTMSIDGRKPQVINYTKEGWRSGNTRLTFDDKGVLRADFGYAYYFLQKQVK